MTGRRQRATEETRTERISGQPVDAKAELWQPDEPENARDRRQDEPERGRDERRAFDPAGRPVPYVDGPTGPAPLATELRGVPGDGDSKPDPTESSPPSRVSSVDR